MIGTQYSLLRRERSMELGLSFPIQTSPFQRIGEPVAGLDAGRVVGRKSGLLHKGSVPMRRARGTGMMRRPATQ